MTDRWNWDFEDNPRAARKESQPVEPTPQQPPPHDPVPGAQNPDAQARARQIRRRRTIAAGALGGILLLALVAALAGGRHRGLAKVSRIPQPPTHTVRSRPPADTEQAENAAVSSVLAYTPFVRGGGDRGREVALTFDDGPGPYTPQVLSVLERFHVHATFFAVGRMLRYFGASTVREIEDGDAIGDHTENHPELAHLSRRDQREELFEQILRVELLGGHRPVLFRPPYGSFNNTTMRQLRALRLLMVLWSVDTNDYEQPGVSVIVERALAGARPGAIILMHDGGGDREQTIAALPQIIRKVRARGLHFVTVPRLLMDDPPPDGLPLPTSLSGD